MSALWREAFAVGACLAFIAGFADASSFVGADGVFCAHVTGNFVVLAADLALHAHGNEWLKLATFPIFVTSVLCSTRVYRGVAEPGRASTRQLLGVVCALFGVAVLLAVAWPRSVHVASTPLIVALLVGAMGAQNAMHRLNPSLGPMTTVMTGNVTGWLVEKMRPGPAENAAKHRVLGLAIAAFALGCGCGALGVAHFGFGALVVPLLVAFFARSRVT